MAKVIVANDDLTKLKCHFNQIVALKQAYDDHVCVCVCVFTD